jgi:ABC-2 type transport system permease protein
MTTTTLDRPAAALPPAAGRAGYLGAVRSEWTKIRTVRSTLWSLLTLLVVSIGISTLATWGRASHDSLSDLRHSDLVRQSMGGIIFGQLVIIVLGALVVTSEYSTGMIRTTLTAQPRRAQVFLAKLTVFTAVALVFGEIVSFASFFVGRHFFSAHGLAINLSDPGTTTAVVGGGLYLAGCGLLAFGLGALLRHTAGAITTGIFLTFVLFILVNFMPDSWQNHVNKWIPFNAGGQIWATHHDPGSDLTPWVGFGVFMIYAVVALIAGFFSFTRRDA